MPLDQQTGQYSYVTTSPPLAVQQLRECLMQCQTVEGFPPDICQARCGSLAPGDIAVPLPGGSSCMNFSSCFAGDLSWQVQSIGGEVGRTLEKAAGALNVPLILVAVIIVGIVALKVL